MYRMVALRYGANYIAVASNQKPNLWKKSINLDFEHKGQQDLINMIPRMWKYYKNELLND